MLRIRLARVGKKHQPIYRVVVADHEKHATKKFVEILGFYNPTQKPKVFEVKKERVEYWISVGAQPSDTVNNLLVDAKILTDKRDIKYSREKLKDEKEEVKAESPKVEKADTTPVADAEAEQASEATEVVAETSTTEVSPEVEEEQTEDKKEETESK
jgi:small subunit ribosomal protein S16